MTDAARPEHYETLPWPDRYRDDPEGRPVQRYSHWFVMGVLKELPEARSQKWDQMADQLGFHAKANSMPVRIPLGSDGIALSWFEPNGRIAEYIQAGGGNAAAQPRTVNFVDLPTDTNIVISNEPAVLDPDIRGDALNRHNGAVNLLAAEVRNQGWTPTLLTAWFSEKPDLAWMADDGIFNLAEVKGLTANNELSQMRIGLGQVLRYRYRASVQYGPVQAWLVTDSAPLDQLWEQVCESVGVRLWWPGRSFAPAP